MTSQPKKSPPFKILGQLSRRPLRSGFAYVLVLGLMSITLGVAYGLMRSRTQDAMVQQNLSRDVDARQAALAGINAGLRAMNESTWTGVGTSLSGSLGNNMTYSVGFSAGDPTLDSSSEAYPYRVTLLSTGTATDPGNSDITANYKIQVVVELIPRALSSTPTGWSTAQNYTVYLWKPDDSDCRLVMEYPSRIEGPVRLQLNAAFCSNYPASEDSRDALMEGLYKLISDWGGYDHRPFNSVVSLKHDSANELFRKRLEKLQVKTNDTATSSSVSWNHPDTILNYKLFPGGPQYTVDSINSSSLSNTSLTASASNPLGIRYRSGSVTFGDSVNFRGTLVCIGSDADLLITGSSVAMEAISLRPLDGSTTPIQLPVAEIQDDIRIASGAFVEINGLVNSQDEFEVQAASQWNQSLALKGRLITKELLIQKRTNWDLGATTWGTHYGIFKSTENLFGKNFAWYLWSIAGLQSYSMINIKPPTSDVIYHWKDASNTIYAPHANDGGGLRWKHIRWLEDV